MKILALETCGEFCSVALYVDGTIEERHVECPARHTGILLPLCEALRAQHGLSLSQLDGIAFGAGPGAFTGVRVAASAAQGMALAHGLPLVAVSSLAALAHEGWRVTGLPLQLPLLDARRKELYWGFYRVDGPGLCAALTSDRVSTADAIAPAGRPFAAIGHGGAQLPAGERARLAPVFTDFGRIRFPRARDVAALASTEFAAGRTLTPELALPIYLRDPLG